MNRRQQIFFLILILGIGIFYLVTLRAGQGWSDDYAMYIHHAKNIVEGISYKTTGYLYDKVNAVLGPRYYPPGYPLLLVPVYAVFGLDLYPMKVETVFFFTAFLYIFYRSFRKQFSAPVLAAIILTIGLNPVMWDFKDGVNSDIPFMCLAYLSLFLIDRVYTRAPSHHSSWKYAVITGLVISAAVLVRSVGLILVAALFAIDLWRYRRLTLFPWIVTLVVGITWLVQTLAIPGESGYNNQFYFTLQTIRYNLVGYYNAFLSYWANGYVAWLTLGLSVLLVLLALWGIRQRFKAGMSIYETFAAAYLASIILWRSQQGSRFLIPFIPVFIMFAYQGLTSLPWKTFPKRIWISLPVLISLAYIGAYTRVDFGPIPTGVEQPTAIALFDFIHENTETDDIFIFAHPRALSLYTERSASGYSTLEPESYNISRCEKIHVDYVIVGSEDDYLRLMVKRYPERFDLVYQNDEFSVFHYISPNSQS